MANSKDLDKRRVITPEFRVSYPSVFEKTAYEDGTPEYSVTALFSKKIDISALKSAAKAAVAEKWGDEIKTWPKKKKESFRWPWRDGDADKPDNPEYEGMYFIKFSSKKAKPGIVAPNGRTIITDEEDFYAGCYARAEVVAYAYDKAGNRGVSFDLWTLQKIRDGEALSGRRSPTEVFEAIEGADEDDLDLDVDDDLDEDAEEEAPKPKKKPSKAKTKTQKSKVKTPPEDEEEDEEEDDLDIDF